MNDELKKLRKDITKAKEELKDAIMTNLRLLVKTSKKTSAMGNKYISVDLFDYKVLELRDGELIFVDGSLNTYSLDNGDCELSDFEDIIRAEDEGREEDEKTDRMREQKDLAGLVWNLAKINIVTCGNCGDVNLHRIFPTESDEDITCARCGFESEPCDFPDLFH